MDRSKFSILSINGLAVLAAVTFGTIPESHSGTFEVSFGAAYSQSNYGGGSYNTNLRLSGSVGYYFLSVTELEIAYQDVRDQTKLVGFQDTVTHDRILSLNIVQTLVPKTFPIQPYIKLGAGQLQREARGTYGGTVAPPAILGSFTVIGGAGLRIYITKNFAIRGEANTYLAGGVLSTWADNVALTSGVSLVF